MSSDEEDLDDGLLFREPQQPRAADSAAAARNEPILPSATHHGKNFDQSWVNSLHQQILEQVKKEGIEACKWGNVLDKWREFLADAPFEQVQFGCVRLILQYARLTPINQPTFYEALRKLGKDILFVDGADNQKERERSNLLNRLLIPAEQDTEYYPHYFAKEEWREDPKSLMNHLDKLRSTLVQELNKERILGFIVPHIRSNKYHPIELGAILYHLVDGISSELSRPWTELANYLQSEKSEKPQIEERRAEAQSFILRCFDNIYRTRQSLEGAEKRNGAVGVILFSDVSATSGCEQMHYSTLDKWYDDNCEKSQNALETFTLSQMKHMIEDEERLWNKWVSRFQKSDFKKIKQPLFQMLNPEKLSMPALMSLVINNIKSYAEKKKNLRNLAAKASKKECVIQAIKDSNSDALDQSLDAPRGGRKIAVFGYTVNHDEKGVPEAAEQSVIVRSVPLTRKHSGDESNALEKLDAHVFEIGVSLAGSYLPFVPKDLDELRDMLRTSGLGLGTDDNFFFFKFIPHGQHSPRSRPIDEILKPMSTASNEKDVYSHVLLTIPDALGSQSTAAYSDIADAGGRFLIDMKRVGSCKTEGMRYHPLAVETAASVAHSEGGKARAFLRLAVLLPPNLPNEMPNNHKLGRLGKEADQGLGFQESAEIIAEVLSLIAIDKSKIDNSKYKTLIKVHLEGNPLLLYYTSIDLLNTVDYMFARIIAEYWEEKLGLGQRKNASNLSKGEQESRKIVLNLITSGVPRGTVGQVDNPHRQDTGANRMNGDQYATAPVVAGKKIALATEAHLRLLPSIIQKETHFAQEEIFVEESNFESILLRLKRACPTSLTFIFVYITGRISADQINQFVSVPANAIKLIFRYSQSLVNLLDLTPSMHDIIYRPESITDVLIAKMRPVAYTDKTAVGAMVNHNTRELKQHPHLNTKAGYYWDNLYPETFVRKAAKWRDDIFHWVHRDFNEEADPVEFLRILITADHTATAKTLADNFSYGENPVIVRVVDAGDRTKFDELKSFVDYKTTPSFSYASGKTAGIKAKPEESSASPMQPQRAIEIFILCRAAFLPHTRLEVLVSRCYARKAKLLLLCNEPTSTISRFRVFKDADSPPMWVRVPTIVQREFKDHSKLSSSVLAFMGLQLIFSHDSIATAEHYKRIERFLESAPQEDSAVDFLDHIDGIPADPSLRAAIVLTLANVEDVADDYKTPNKKTLAEILSMHINRYLRFPADVEECIISFSDFCRQPRARFLSQIHRVEAYMCYICSKTDVHNLVPAAAGATWPLGFPLGVSFSGLQHNIHMASHPGSLLSAIFENDVTSLDTVSYSLPPPQYIDPGRGDVVTHMQEIAEHRAITGAELHWEEMFVKWETGPEITDDVLDHIIIHSPSRISVLLCMTPPRIVNLSLSKKALEAISHDFQNCEDSLRQLSPETSRTLRTRAAAIWWLLLKKGEYSTQICDDVFAVDQGLVLESNIYIEADDTSLLFRVTCAMLPLDTMDIFISQHAVRDFILSDSVSIYEILENEGIKIGRAFITACVARETLNAIITGVTGKKIFDKIGNILKWVRDPSAGNVDLMRKDMALFAQRFTPLAISGLLTSCNPPFNFAIARDGILEPCICHAEQLHKEGARLFLSEVLKALCQLENRGLAVELFQVLAKPASRDQVDFPTPHLNSIPASWQAMYAAMRDSLKAEEFFQIAQEEVFLIPFEVSEKLCELYINVFCADGRDISRDLELHCLLLQSDLQRNAIYKYMTTKSIANSNSSVLCLTWFTWWSRASSSFSIQYLPSRETWHIFQRVARKVRLNEQTSAEGLSTIARFAVAPHTLPASTLNALKYAMVGPEPVVVSEKYVLAQFESTIYPVYGFRTHVRHLPRECIDSLIMEVQGHVLNGFSTKDTKETLKLLFPITDSGVSKDIVQRNLNILVNIDQSPPSNDVDKTPQMRAQIFLPTLAWFFAAGFGMDDLKAMLNQNQKDKLANNHGTMLSVWNDPQFPKALVYCPLPVYVDVRFVCGKTGSLFQLNQESASITVQWLTMLGLHYRLIDFTEPQAFQDYASDRNSGKHVDPEFPKKIVCSTMHRIASAIAREHDVVKLGRTNTDSFHAVFVLDESGSMAGDPWKNLIIAVRNFLDTRMLIGAEDLISIITFTDSARIICERMPIEDCNRDLATLLIQQMGGTAFSPALRTAHEILVRGRADTSIRPFMLFMSDGGSNDGDQEMRDIARDFSQQIQVKTLAFGSSADASKLRTLANLAGGEFTEAKDGAAIRERFADVAHNLARTKNPTKQEDADLGELKELKKAEYCSAVTDSCVPLADFFAQLRIGSQSLAKFALEGLSEGLKQAGASIDLQVYVADALYMLIGVTPVNSGIEVMFMLEMWRIKGLTIGSSVIMEITFMAKNIYHERGLNELARKLLHQIQATNPRLKRVPYVRSPANTPLSVAVREPEKGRETDIYSFTQLQMIYFPGRNQSKAIQEANAQAKSSPIRASGRADFDHAREHASWHRASNHKAAVLPSLETSDSPNVEEVDIFRSAASDSDFDSGHKALLHRRQAFLELSKVPRTISARDLVHIDTGPGNDVYSGFAIIRIVPGLHPVLRSPGDSQNIPVSQQTSLGRGHSFDREDHAKVGKDSKIEAIFSNNGGTWANLCQLAADSTIMGKGFYLRKSNEGWVLLVGATSQATLEHSPLVLWTILDTMKLAALDFSDSVVDTLRALVCLAYDPIKTDGRMETSAFKHLLEQIRSWNYSARRQHDNEDSQKYFKYLQREFIICKHLLQVMNAIREDTRGSAMVMAFQAPELESKLKVQVDATEHGLNQIIGYLSQFIGVRDWVPRSQLTFTLELVLANHPGHFRELNPRSEETRSTGAPKSDSSVVSDGSELQSDDVDDEWQVKPTTTTEGTASSFPKNKLIAAHEHITQYKFHQQSLQMIKDIEERKQIKNQLDWIGKFCDSDMDEQDDFIPPAQATRSRSEDDHVLNDALRERGIGEQRSRVSQYEDDSLDMPRDNGNSARRIANPIFSSEWGYGYPICSQFCVTSITGEHVPLYFVLIDVRRLKIQYNDADGLPIAFIFHKRLLDKSLKYFRTKEEEKKKLKEAREGDDASRNEESSKMSPEDLMLAYREQLLQWLTDLIRSPLPTAAKDWFLDKLENGPTTRCVPSLSINESEEDVGGDLNLVVIAHCIATALPTPNECRQLFRKAFHIPRGFMQFCKRKNDLYGVHIVRGGTLQELLDYGAVVEVCSLGYDALTRSKDNASMYLSIIGHFSTFTWLVYVTGLDHIDDALLKWLAEYTRVHPWRFVYLENTHTSWNFSENRDRCIYDRAPPPVERSIRTTNDLKNPEISHLRPTHTQPYPRISQHCDLIKTTQQSVLGNGDWEQISRFTRTFFRNSSAQSGFIETDVDWSTGDEGDCGSDYREKVKEIFDSNEPCIVLLCSPPGAGKSYFSNQLAEMLKRKHSIGRAFIDGSDDRLVDMALTEILDVELPDPSKSQFLVVDEFHMLKDHHKQDLFNWLHEHSRRLHVLLIANRKDANDEKHLEELKNKREGNGQRICLFSTRLGNALLEEVMQDRKTDSRNQGQIRRWMHCCRCLFGGEAVSLRGIPALEEKLKTIGNKAGTADDLVNLLLDKVPTVSEATAKEFVAAYMASCEPSGTGDTIARVAHKVKGPVSLMVQAALLTEDDDLVGMDFPDFVSFGLERAYDAPPTVRIAAWCSHIRFFIKDQNQLQCMDSPKSIFQSLLVDQCGFPLQLEEPGPPDLSEGPAFSWGGDYSRMQDIIDAVKHGHSVDWSDVHERCWKCEHVQDSRLLVELLSVCTSPSKVLNALAKDNLCALLKKSTPDDTLSIANNILKYQTYLASSKSDKFVSPYRTAVWLVMCYDKNLNDPVDMLNHMSASMTENQDQETDTMDWRENELVDALIWASTHMMDMVTCRADDSSRNRSKYLKSILIYLGEKLIITKDNLRAPRLWSGMFAPLLQVSTRLSEKSKEVEMIGYVAIHAEDLNSKWCPALRTLWSVAHGRGSADQVADIWTRHSLLLLTGDNASPVHPKLAGGILCVTGVIPSDLQMALLTRGGAVDLEMVGSRIDNAMELLRGAIETIVKGDEGRLNMADGPFKQYVLNEAKQFREAEAV